MNALGTEAQHLAVDLGWRVLPVKPHGKEPLTRNGVKDATVDERAILHYWERWPDANVGIATGAPGPSVLDVDDPQAAAFVLAGLENADTPESATARGRHLFYAGSQSGTIRLGFGELRGIGSYVVVPPSVHPSGKAYVWLIAPRSRTLPPVPPSLVADKQSAGIGELAVRDELVPHGERHDYLKGVAVHLLRGGITDAPTLVIALRSAYEANCEQQPPARADEFQQIAQWAQSTRIAARERNRAEHRERQDAGVEVPSFDVPALGASVAEHSAFIAKLAGLPVGVEIAAVRRFGLRPADRMEIDLSNGELIVFGKQEDAAKRGLWQRIVVMATSGSARPPLLKDQQLVALLSSLCRVAHVPVVYRESEELAETLRSFLALCESLDGDLATPASRYDLIVTLRARDAWEPFDRNTRGRPVLITDTGDGARYVRGGELADWFRFKGARLSGEAFPGRMAMIGLERVEISSRAPVSLYGDVRNRPRPHTVLYRLREVVE